MEPGSGVGTFDASSERYLVESATNGPERTLITRDVSLGDRMRVGSQASQDILNVRRTIAIQPSFVDFDRLWPRIIGGTKGVDLVIEPDGTVPRFGYAELLGDTNAYWRYDDMQVGQATLTGRTGEFVTMTLDMLGRNLTKVAGAIPKPAMLQTEPNLPIVFSKALLYLSPVGADDFDWCFSDFTLTINNNLVPKFYNSVTPKCVAEGQRQITLQVSSPWNNDSMTKLYGLGDAGYKAQIRFHGTNTLESHINLGVLKWPDSLPNVPNLQDINHTITAEVMASGAADEFDIWIYNDIVAV